MRSRISPSPQILKMENNIPKEIEMHRKVYALWNAIEKGSTDFVLPIDKEERTYCVHKLIGMMERNEEKYRDKEGGEFYERIRIIIEQLSS